MSTPHPPYPKPPITEAVIDIRAMPGEGAVLEDLHKFATSHSAEYGIEELREQSASVCFDADHGFSAQPTDEPQAVGYRLNHKTEPFVLQVRADTFVFSRLEPYAGWAVLRDEAKRLWEGYRGVFAGTPIKRLATRYINRIDIPEQEVELTRYFRTLPELSSDMPQPHMGRYHMQIHLPQPDMEANAILNQALVPPAREGVNSIMLDIDLFRTDNLSGQEPGMWALLDTLRDRKNEIFESSITNHTRRLFG